MGHISVGVDYYGVPWVNAYPIWTPHVLYTERKMVCVASLDWKNNGVCSLSCLCFTKVCATCKAFFTWVMCWLKLSIKCCVDCSCYWCAELEGLTVRGISEGARSWNPKQTLKGEKLVEECVALL